MTRKNSKIFFWDNNDPLRFFFYCSCWCCWCNIRSVIEKWKFKAFIIHSHKDTTKIPLLYKFPVLKRTFTREFSRFSIFYVPKDFFPVFQCICENLYVHSFFLLIPNFSFLFSPVENYFHVTLSLFFSSSPILQQLPPACLTMLRKLRKSVCIIKRGRDGRWKRKIP